MIPGNTVKFPQTFVLHVNLAHIAVVFLKIINADLAERFYIPAGLQLLFFAVGKVFTQGRF